MPLIRYVGVDVEELPGVGSKTAQVLKSHGILHVEDIILVGVRELSEILSEDKAWELLRQAMSFLEKQGIYRSFIPADMLLELGQNKKFSTGSQNLDKLFDGGLEVNNVYELVGEFGAGKTQICHQLAIYAQLPEDKGGLGGKVLWIDTEGTFRPERIIEIVESRKLGKPEDFLRNIIYVRAYTSDHLLMLMEDLMKIDGIKLIVVDSVIAPFRAEYPGRENLAERQQKLSQLLRRIHILAIKNTAVAVVTNQVIANPGAYFGEALKPAGGNIVAHLTTHRVWIRKAKENLRIAKIFDSPLLPMKEVQFKITKAGIE